MAKRKLSDEERAKVSDMAEKMAGSTFKGKPGFGPRKSQIFAITTNQVKKQRGRKD